MKIPLSPAIAIGFGLVVLLGYFLDIPQVVLLRDVLLRWAIILAAVALLVGVANLFAVHWGKITKGRSGGIYSLVLAVSLVLTLVVAGTFGPTGTWSQWIFNNIQLPVETSLMAVLAVVLVYASIRLLRRRLNIFTLVFFLTVVFMLLSAAPFLGFDIPGLHGPDGLRALVARIPATAGARGILLGVALGTIATGLRVLMGADRPYRG
jgi:hypothetical protein